MKDEYYKKVQFEYKVLSGDDYNSYKKQNINLDKIRNYLYGTAIDEYKWGKSDFLLVQKFKINGTGDIQRFMPTLINIYSIYVFVGKYEYEGKYIDNYISVDRKGKGENGINIHTAEFPALWTVNGELDVYSIHVDMLFLNKMLWRMGQIDPNKVKLRPSFIVEDPLMSDIVIELIHELENMNDMSNLYIDSLMQTLGFHLLKKYCDIEKTLSSESKNLTGAMLQDIIEYIDQNLDEKLTISELASQINLSSSYFAHLFKLATGKSPHNFVMSRRIFKAQRLLLFTDMTLSEIASYCGFSSQAHMTNCFRKEFNMSPTEIRKEHYSKKTPI